MLVASPTWHGAGTHGTVYGATSRGRMLSSSHMASSEARPMSPRRRVAKRKVPVRSTGLSKATGRPRDARIDTEVITAVIRELQKGGYGAVTIEGIAKNV